MRTHEFTIDGTTFEVAPLKLKQSLRAEALLVEVFLPAVASLASATKTAVIDPASLAGLSRLGELVDLFAGVCRVDWDKGGGAVARVALTPFLDNVFARRNAALLAWLAACVEWQYADFFDASGRALLEGAANRFGSLLELTGGSGGSPSTGESPTG